MPSSNDQKRQNEKLLPWLLNNTLDAEEKKQLEDEINNSKELQSERDFLIQLRQQIKKKELPDVPLDFAWQRLKKEMANDKKQSDQPQKVSARWRFVAMAASLLLVVQSGTLMFPNNHDDYFVPLSTNDLPKNSNQTLLKIRFVDTATQLDVNNLLREHHLVIVSGPSAAGLYQVVTINNSDDLLKALKNKSEIIAHVQKNE